MVLLNIKNLDVTYRENPDNIRAIDNIDLSVESGEILGIVGESGSGKSTIIKSLINILDSNGSVTGGEIRYKDENLADYSTKELNQKIRWSEISYIPQNAMASLDPVYRIGTQIVEVIQTHTDTTKQDAKNEAARLVQDVGLDKERMYDFPHELSGGQRQRAVIALALALEPSLILADEPTTGLDVVIQDEMLKLLSDVQEDLGCAIVFVTHDMSVVAELSDTIAVMYGGRVMEYGPTEEVLNDSSHPYTIGLKNAFPTLDRRSNMDRLVSIPGSPPDLRNAPDGCRFASRCPFATDKCGAVEPPTVELDDDRSSKCHYTDNSSRFRKEGKLASTWEPLKEEQ